MGASDGSNCLAQQTLLAWAAGELESASSCAAEAHLAECDDCLSRMAAILHGLRNTADASSSEAKRSAFNRHSIFFPGEVVADKYQVEAVIGAGGMGVLFSARHVEIGHDVAIKVLHTQSADAAARFLREARIYARLSSPHIPQIYDFGRLPGGAPFIVMELLSGRDLARVVARGPLAISEVADYIQQACRALGEVHGAGIVHRDVKPANLFVVERPEAPPLLKLLDFGIAKFRDAQEGSDALQFTSTTQLLGSPLYMSPEQVLDSKDVDYRTDIWSLGVVLYQLLTGRPPFQTASFSRLCVSIATEAPAPPRALRPELPPALEAVTLRCLEKHVEHRLANLAEVVEALEPFTVRSPRAVEATVKTSTAVPALRPSLVREGPGHAPTPLAALVPVTVMFADVTGFNSLAENLPPEQVARALDLYLRAATRAVESSGGTVNQYMGDALMALWNAFSPLPEHPAAACRATLECVRATAELARSPWWHAAALAPWQVRFGMHTARILVGRLGSPDQPGRTAVGDGVNLASRLEGLNKLYGTTILVSSAVRTRAGDAFVFRQVDRIAIDGKPSCPVYELCGTVDDPETQARQASIARYEAALHAMWERNFEAAKAGFSSLTDDRAARELAKRCQAWLATPPPKEWDGTWTMSPS